MQAKRVISMAIAIVSGGLIANTALSGPENVAQVTNAQTTKIAQPTGCSQKAGVLTVTASRIQVQKDSVQVTINVHNGGETPLLLGSTPRMKRPTLTDDKGTRLVFDTASGLPSVSTTNNIVDRALAWDSSTQLTVESKDTSGFTLVFSTGGGDAGSVFHVSFPLAVHDEKDNRTLVYSVAIEGERSNDSAVQRTTVEDSETDR